MPLEYYQKILNRVFTLGDHDVSNVVLKFELGVPRLNLLKEVLNQPDNPLITEEPLNRCCFTLTPAGRQVGNRFVQLRNAKAAINNTGNSTYIHLRFPFLPLPFPLLPFPGLGVLSGGLSALSLLASAPGEISVHP